MHPWHDVGLISEVPGCFRAVIEIPAGSDVQFKLDPASGLLNLKEFLSTIAIYPANYGFFPRTLAADGDPFDVFVVTRRPLLPLILTDARPLGGIETRSSKKGPESKIIAVCPGDADFSEAKHLADLPRSFMKRLGQFFETYKALEGDKKSVSGTFGARKSTPSQKRGRRGKNGEALQVRNAKHSRAH